MHINENMKVFEFFFFPLPLFKLRETFFCRTKREMRTMIFSFFLYAGFGFLVGMRVGVGVGVGFGVSKAPSIYLTISVREKV